MAAIEPKIYKLNTLDFSLGIRAEEINDNFDLIRYWIEAERLRTGGWGLVEGFELTRDLSNFTIHVDKGILINEHGAEIHVNEHTFGPIPISFRAVRDVVTSDENGKVILSYPVYINALKHVIVYAPEFGVSEDEKDKISNEIQIVETDTGRELKLDRDIVYIAETEIQLTPQWANTEFRIDYNYAADRIDAVFVKKDGSEYMDPMPTGIISTSPSQEVVQDYFANGWYLIGFAYWHVGQEIDVEFFTGDRTLRKVFVDKNNILYLNGKPYKEKTVIYFVEPDPPQENDLWFNVEDEVLYIWRPDEYGVYGWLPVNDLSRSMASVHQFSEGENPDDLRTFDFSAYPELMFIPGQHQVTVIVDQIVLMQDQYIELYPEGGEGLPCGTGIQLVHPLERPSIVEIRVRHNINTSRKKIDLFPHEAFYGASGSYTVTDPAESIFTVKCQYEYLSSQIEVYRNGLSLVEGTDYQGILLNGNVANTKGQLCDRIQIASLQVNDVIAYRILRPVASYTNLQSIIQQYEDELNDCEARVTEAVTALAETKTELEDVQATLADRITGAEGTIEVLQETALTAPVQPASLDSSITSGIVTGTINLQINTDATSLFLNNVKPTDFITVAYAPDAESDLILLSALRNDYTIVATNGGSLLKLASRWLDDATAKVYITGIRIGV